MIDCHCHLFSPRVISNCLSQPRMIEELKMDVVGAANRLEPEQLLTSARETGVDRCVLLPTAAPDGVVDTNTRFLTVARSFAPLETMGTLHPAMDGLEREVERLLTDGFCGVKLSTFSQRFDLRAELTHRMMTLLAKEGARHGRRPTVLLDTYVRADRYFGAQPDHLTTPGRLSALVLRHPGVDFVGAHMGGLFAGAKALLEELEPRANLYLDTSNASRTLDRTTDRTGAIPELALAQVKQARVIGSYCGRYDEADYPDERILTLDELLAIVPEDKVLALELKDPALADPKNARQLVTAVRARIEAQTVMLLSFHTRLLRAAQRADPQVWIGKIGMFSPLPIFRGNGIGTTWPAIKVNPLYMWIARAFRLWVCPLDPTPEERLAWYIKMDVDAVLTDDPARTRQALAEQRAPHSKGID